MYPVTMRRAPVRLEVLPIGDAGTYRTVDVMKSLARAAQMNDTVRRLGESLAGGNGSAVQRALRLRDWLARHFLFVRDPASVELLTTPGEQLRQIADTGSTYGDCDDAATLGAALAIAGGLPVRYVLYGFGPPPSFFSHVFVEIPTSAGAVDLDVTRPMQSVSRPTRVQRIGG
jgi:transglutaminase-like putative cysteine protease